MILSKQWWSVGSPDWTVRRRLTVGIILASFVLMFLGLILLVFGALTETAAIYLWGQCVAMITGVNGSYLAACHYGDKKKGHQDAGIDSR